MNTPRRNVDLVLIFNTIQYIYIYKYISFGGRFLWFKELVKETVRKMCVRES